MKTADLIGTQLDLWVAKAERIDPSVDAQLKYMPSANWEQAGPIIEREGIHIAPMPGKGSTWCATAVGRLQDRANATPGPWIEGPTPLVAAMRAFVAVRFGTDIQNG